MDPRIEAWFRARIHNPRTLERTLRANHGLQNGETIRGGFRLSSQFRQYCRCYFHMRRGEAIRLFGRRVWDMLPRAAKRRHGRREAAPLNLLHELQGIAPGREAEAAAMMRWAYRKDGTRHFTEEWFAEWRELFA
jgi:hypothetical protein